MAEVLKEEDYNYCIESHDLQSLLSVRGRDFLVRNNGDEVNVSNLQGKLVAFYFSGLSCRACRRFNPKLCKAYDELLSRHQGTFEVVFVSADDNEDSFWMNFANMPWLAIPFCDTLMQNRLNDLFSVQKIPHLVIFDESGKRCSEDGVQMISKFGSEAYPFTIEKFNENREAARRLQRLQDMLGSPTRNFLISCNGDKVPISDLVGKNLLLYFSASNYRCRWYQDIHFELTEVYRKIKSNNSANFEIISIWKDSKGQCQNQKFHDNMLKLPWLRLPFDDERNETLKHRLKIYGTPSVVVIGPNGNVAREAMNYILTYGADAYPFTGRGIKELEAHIEDISKEWPKMIKNPIHGERELVLVRRRAYTCDNCKKKGKWWAFYCNGCDSDLHPKCALDENTEMNDVCYNERVEAEEEQLGRICM